MKIPPSSFPLLLLSPIIFFFPTSILADPRITLIQLNCTRLQFQPKSSTLYQPNFNTAIGNLSIQLQSNHTSLSATTVSVSASRPIAAYALTQCYGDLSSVECQLCYSQAQTLLPQCFPATGGAVFLDGCFLRADNYSFFDEISGPNDRAICGNRSVSLRSITASFNSTVKAVVAEAVTMAGEGSDGFGKAVGEVVNGSGSSVYALANCWGTLSSSKCRECLMNASAMVMQGCLSTSAVEGRAVKAGCFLRYSDSDFLNDVMTTGNRRGTKGTVMIVVVSVVSSLVVLSITLALGLYHLKRRRIHKKRRGSNDAERLVNSLSDRSLNFKYSTLEKATSSFAESNKIGQGGFGTVYKGVLADGREIAVKRLFFNIHHRAADFYNEVNIVSSVEHKNLVRLLGCSCSGPESLLVYEFLPNRSLDRFIFDNSSGRTLTWERRNEVIIGTAEGLAYLHENKTTPRIIHRDIKASNILLDSRFRPKIADFGLARSFQQEDQSHISTAIAGTLGYMAPEYLAHGQLTEKADVYSFGVLILEIVTGKQNTRTNAPQTYSDTCLLATVWKHFQQDSIEELFDPNLRLQQQEQDGENEEESTVKKKNEVARAVHIGLLCTQEAPTLRPSMSRVVQMLRKKNGILPTPTIPPFTDERTMELNDVICDNPCRPLTSTSSDSIVIVSNASFYTR